MFCATSSILVAGIIALASGSPFRSVLLDGTPVRLGTWPGSLSLGVLAVMAADGQMLAFVVALAPALALQYGYSGAVRQWRERREADAMHEAAGRIRATVSSAQVREELMAKGGLLGTNVAGLFQPTGGSPAPGYGTWTLLTPLREGADLERSLASAALAVPSPRSAGIGSLG